VDFVKIKGVQAMKKTRKTRGDYTVGSFEKKHGLPAGTIRNKDGRDTRSDKKLEPSEKS
jgi:hypothetical protein